MPKKIQAPNDPNHIFTLEGLGSSVNGEEIPVEETNTPPSNEFDWLHSQGMNWGWSGSNMPPYITQEWNDLAIVRPGDPQGMGTIADQNVPPED